MNRFLKFGMAGLLACAAAAPQMASASLIDEDITVRFDWILGVTPQIDIDTQDTTATGPGGIGHVWQDGDGTQLDDYFFSGDALSLGTDAMGDFLTVAVGSAFAWGPMRLTISGWEETLLNVNDSTGADILSNTGVSGESLLASQWSATLNFATNTTNQFYFAFDDGSVTSPVPLPAGGLLLLGGLGGLALARRRRRS